MKEIIKVDKLDIGNNEVCCKISCSRELRKFFLNSFFAKYDRDIENVDRSILQSLERAKRFSWEKTARETLKVYKGAPL